MKNVKYEYWIDGLLICIHDLHGRESVTVHAEDVLLEIEQELGALEGKWIIWRDGDHIWDGFFYRNRRIGIYPLGSLTTQAAREKIDLLPIEIQREYTFNGDSLKDAQKDK